MTLLSNLMIRMSKVCGRVYGHYYHIYMELQWNLHWFAWRSTQFGTFNQFHYEVFQVVKLFIVFMHLFHESKTRFLYMNFTYCDLIYTCQNWANLLSISRHKRVLKKWTHYIFELKIFISSNGFEFFKIRHNAFKDSCRFFIFQILF